MPNLAKMPSPESPPRRRRRSSQEVADRILTAATQEFGEAGYAGATTAAIAKRADVTEAQIFRLYDSKQSLFKAAIFGPLNEHFVHFMGDDRSIGGDGRTLARAYISELSDFMAEHSKMLMSLIVASAYSPEAGDSVSDMEGLQAYFEQGAATMRKRRLTKETVSPEMMVRVSFAAVLANLMFKDWLFPKGTPDAEIRKAITEFVIGGIEANGPVGEL